MKKSHTIMYADTKQHHVLYQYTEPLLYYNTCILHAQAESDSLECLFWSDGNVSVLDGWNNDVPDNTVDEDQVCSHMQYVVYARVLYATAHVHALCISCTHTVYIRTCTYYYTYTSAYTVHIRVHTLYIYKCIHCTYTCAYTVHIHTCAYTVHIRTCACTVHIHVRTLCMFFLGYCLLYVSCV